MVPQWRDLSPPVLWASFLSPHRPPQGMAIPLGHPGDLQTWGGPLFPASPSQDVPSSGTAGTPPKVLGVPLPRWHTGGRPRPAPGG